MKRCFEIGRYVVALVAFACLTGSQPAAAQTLAIEPLKDSGSNIYPAFEGWYQNSDGTYTLLIGYYNRNKKQIARYSDWSREPDRAGRSRPGTADALRRSAAAGARSRSRCRKISATRSWSGR